MWKQTVGCIRKVLCCGAGLFVTGLLLQWQRWRHSVGACLHGRSMSIVSGAVLCIAAGRDAWASQTGVSVSDGSVIIRLQFLPWSVWPAITVIMGLGTAGSLHPSFGNDVHRLFENAFFLAVSCYFTVWLVAVLGTDYISVPLFPSGCA